MRNRSGAWHFDLAAATATPERPTTLTWPVVAGDLTLYLAAVAPKSFCISWFKQHEIVYPACIARSAVKRQAGYFAGRLCARRAVESLGLSGTQVETGTLGEPIWPAGLIGSISHTNTHAVTVVLPESRYRGIGIDLEIVPDRNGVEALHSVALSKAESALIRTNSQFSEDLLATLIFSAKESFFKATAARVRRFFDFSAIECVDITGDVMTCVVREPLAPALQPGLLCRFDIASGGRSVLTCFRW